MRRSSSSVGERVGLLARYRQGGGNARHCQPGVGGGSSSSAGERVGLLARYRRGGEGGTLVIVSGGGGGANTEIEYS